MHGLRDESRRTEPLLYETLMRLRSPGCMNEKHLPPPHTGHRTVVGIAAGGTGEGVSPPCERAKFPATPTPRPRGRGGGARAIPGKNLSSISGHSQPPPGMKLFDQSRQGAQMFQKPSQSLA